MLHHQPHSTLPDLSRIPLALAYHRPILSSDQASNIPGAVQSAKELRFVTQDWLNDLTTYLATPDLWEEIGKEPLA